ncbi:MAG: hypothetical protein JWO58_465 [Chitinophagaceae bacterium]|nr:hypothetical protein [Chitinophagaceae bacterium]
MDKFISQQDKVTLAAAFGVEYKALNAVFLIESSGAGFDKATGKIKIQFEPYWFHKYTGQRIANGVGLQGEEWTAFHHAASIDKAAALKSTSWGLGQVMGFNFKAAGFADVDTMVTSFEQSEYNQLKGMLNFIKSTPKMLQALQTKDWATFAKYYNGPHYKDFKYDTRLAAAYAKS